MKRLMFLVVILLLAMATSVFAFPTYTSTSVANFHGNYGNSSHPCIISDETGNQLFDGDYGMFDWLKKATVQSDADYDARYEQQKGYGLPWISWQSGYREIATFDMNNPFTFNQIGFHCYFRLPDIFLPEQIALEFSNDGLNFGNSISGTFSGHGPTNDETYWVNFGFAPVEARFCRIYAFIMPPGDLFIDEMSINGMDGAQFPVPEPSSLLALVSGIAPLVLLRRIKG